VWTVALGGDLGDVAAIRDGLDLIMSPREPAFEPSDPRGGNVQALLDAADNMWEEMHERAERDDVTIGEYERVIKASVEELKEALKPVRWRVQEGLIPEVLKQRGVLEFLQQSESEDGEKAEEGALVVDAVFHVEGAGEYFLL
jgi:hypothetical protein